MSRFPFPKAPAKVYRRPLIDGCDKLLTECGKRGRAAALRLLGRSGIGLIGMRRCVHPSHHRLAFTVC